MTDDTRQAEKLKIFISYARDDLEFADQLVTFLEWQNFIPIIDRHEINGAEPWKQRLAQLILESDVVVFVLSPDSANSEICGWEVEQAARRGKRVVPVICRGLDRQQPHPRLRDLNYIHFCPDKDVPGAGYGSGFKRLVEALSIDVAWLREHTRLEELAARWDRHKRPTDELLRGSELGSYKAWRDQRPPNAPGLTTLQRALLAESEAYEEQQQDEQRKLLNERERLQQDIATAQRKRAEALAETEKAQQARAEAAAIAENEQKLKVTALTQAKEEQEQKSRAQNIALLISIATIAGLVGWLNEIYVKEQLNWYFVMRPYMKANFLPFVLSAEHVKNLKPQDRFRECSRDCPEMAVIPSGSALIGSPETEAGRNVNEGPQRMAVLTKPFAVSRFPVTFSEWDACASVGGCPPIDDGDLGRGQKPAIAVTWDEAQQYVAWLSRMSGQQYRLLSEVEFEYAARAGTTTAYPWGDQIGLKNANCRGCGSEWDKRTTAPVGSFHPNQFGLFDMHGNIYQWVADCYSENLDDLPLDGSPRTDSNCKKRVARGGSWYYGPDEVRSAFRLWILHGTRRAVLGFRVARTLEQ